MKVLAVVIGLLGALALPLLGGVGGIIMILFAIALYIYGAKEAGKKKAEKESLKATYASSPAGIAAERAAKAAKQAEAESSILGRKPRP